MFERTLPVFPLQHAVLYMQIKLVCAFGLHRLFVFFLRAHICTCMDDFVPMVVCVMRKLYQCVYVCVGKCMCTVCVCVLYRDVYVYGLYA